jgi:cytochrome c-type biogenesis protein CcmH
MLLWILMALMTGGVVAALVHPLLRKRAYDAEPQKTDIDTARALYAAQVAELERDAAAARMSAGELESGRAELGRRLLRAVREAEAAAATAAVSYAPSLGKSDARAPVLALALTIFVTSSAVATYLTLGSPHVASQDPIARAKAVENEKQYRALIQQLEAALAQGKGDAQGWALLANAYYNLRDTAREVDALKRGVAALTAKGERVPSSIHSALGSALVREAQGQVNKPAADAFRTALNADPKDVSARFHLGLAKKQDGDASGALEFWRPLLAELKNSSPLYADLAKRISELNAAPMQPRN